MDGQASVTALAPMDGWEDERRVPLEHAVGEPGVQPFIPEMSAGAAKDPEVPFEASYRHAVDMGPGRGG